MQQALQEGKIVFQEIPDSPTVRYYTNWNIYKERLGIADATILDTIMVDEDRYDCIVDFAAKSLTLKGKSCKIALSDTPLAGENEGPRLLNKEGMLTLHSKRVQTRAILTIEDSQEILVISRSGNGYTGYSLEIHVPVESSSHITLLDTGLNSHGLKTECIRLVQGRGSKTRLDIVNIHTGTPVYEYFNAWLSERASLDLRIAGVSGLMTRLRGDILLLEDNSRINSLIGTLASNNKRGDYIVNVVHQAPLTESLVLARGAGWNGGTLALRGIARVSRKASKSRTRVEAHVTVFDERTRGYAVPMLEIYTGDVEEASHSASVSSLTEEEGFYLATRGFSLEETKLLIVKGLLEYTGIFENREELLNSISNLLF